MTKELQALQDADFGWVHSLESVWSNEGSADAGPNQAAADSVIADLVKLTKAPNPPGRVLIGQAGIGKTHLVGVLRRRAFAERCWFVMLDVVGITDFWKSAALSFVTSLLQETSNGQRQYEAVITGVARRFKVEKEVDIAYSSPTIEPKRIVDLLVGVLIKTDMQNALQYQDVFRALALLRSRDIATVGIAHAWLQGYDAEEGMRTSLGFRTPPPDPIYIVRGLLWVMGLAGPTLIAVDQIDGVVSSGDRGRSDFGDGTNFTALLGGGLLDLLRVTNRSLVVMTCLLSSWEILRSDGPAPLEQSFAAPMLLRPMQSDVFVRTLIADRLAPAYAKAGVQPKSVTWPFTDAAILSASSGMTPRKILMRCDEHRRLCLGRGTVSPCETLKDDLTTIVDPVDPVDFRVELESATAKAELGGLFDDKDDGMLGGLLRDVFDLYAKQVPSHDDYDVVSKPDPAQRTPPLHGRVTFIDHRANDRERHFCFRALQHSNAVAFCSRLRAALTASGIVANIASRKLVIVRRGPPPTGPKTKELFDAFRAAGGLVIDPSEDDLRTFVALRAMRDAALAESRFDAFERWLVASKPLCATALFKDVGLCPPPLPPWDDRSSKEHEGNSVGAPRESVVVRDGLRPPHHEGLKDTGQAPPPVKSVLPGDAETARDITSSPGFEGITSREPPPTSIPIGHRLSADATPVSLPIDILPRHIAIIAGAGSGKTVLLRRIVEEAALAGIPAIVVDPNNDLARLGDAWPEPPSNFTAEDAAKAKRYRESVEVVVWTPGIHAGNPLFLSVLPDFAAVGDDPDERAQAVTMAVDTLAPLAGARTDIQQGVLSAAVRRFAEKRGGGLNEMTALLADLPEGVSAIRKAEEHAAKMADGLIAAVETNPLLKAGGAVLDPAALFYGADPGRTRVSVINLSGLGSDKAKQDLVNRLQMTLFGWIKKHPSPTGRLYVLDEAQNFVPSGAGALSKTSGVQLVAQARKYGLGMIVVTQAPKGIDNKVVSNCTTQFLGKQNSPTDQQTVRDMVAATGGAADDIGRLSTGQFYFKTEKSGRPYKVATPICLSWHPANPPTPEEVITRARRSAA